MIKTVYVAGPLSCGDVGVNIRNAIDAAEELSAHGFMPFVPHLFFFWYLVHKHDYSFWISLDNTYLKLCDAVYLLPGKSPGAEDEVKLAKRLGIPVFTSMEDLLITAAVTR